MARQVWQDTRALCAVLAIYMSPGDAVAAAYAGTSEHLLMLQLGILPW